MPGWTRLSISEPFDESSGSTFTARFDESSRIVDGHYPGFAIVPGAVLVELSIEAARRSHREGSIADCVFPTVESARFLSAVRPGDTVTFSTETRDADNSDLVTRVQARRSDGVPCCRTRIRFTDTGKPS